MGSDKEALPHQREARPSSLHHEKSSSHDDLWTDDSVWKHEQRIDRTRNGTFHRDCDQQVHEEYSLNQALDRIQRHPIRGPLFREKKKKIAFVSNFASQIKRPDVT